jgi:hypothetical protein
MFEKLAEIKQAKAKVVEGSLAIWNARLDAMVQAGYVQDAIDQLRSAVEFGDNCDCHCGEGFKPGNLVAEMRPSVKK